MPQGPLRLQRETLLLGAILVLGLVLRLWGLDFGLPNLSRPDEQNVADAVFRILNSFFAGEPSLNPHFFHYPSLYLYIMALVYWGYYIIGQITGLFPDAEAFYGLYLNDWGSFFLLSRLVAALCGTATLWAIYRLGKTVARSTSVGLAAAFLLAITYLHVRDSHFGVTDMPATLLVTLSLWQSVRFYQTGKFRTLYRAAMLAGLAAATKYPAGLVAVPVLLAYALQCQTSGWNLKNLLSRPALLRQMALLSGCLFGAFLLGSPYVLLDFPQFWEDYRWQSAMQFNSVMVDLGMGWGRHLSYTLWHGLGPVYLLASLLSMVWLYRHHAEKPLHWLLLGFAGLYYLLIGNSHLVFVRYVIPILPIFALYTAWGSAMLAEKLTRRFPTLPQAALTGALLLIVGGQSLWSSLQFDMIAARPDTRTLARQWLIEHLRPGDGVGTGTALAGLQLPAHYRKYELVLPQKNGTRSPLPALPSGRANYTEAINPRNERLINTYGDVERLRSLGIRYVAVGLSPLTLYDLLEEELGRLESNPDLERVKRFSPYAEAGPPPTETYDQLDAFYIPYSSPGAQKRPGPEIRIYRVLPD